MWTANDDRNKRLKQELNKEVRGSALRHYVYAHYMDGILQYIGKGVGTRGTSEVGRTACWYEARDNCVVFHPVIVSWHFEDAVEAEAYLIQSHKPPCNIKHSKSSPAQELPYICPASMPVPELLISEIMNERRRVEYVEFVGPKKWVNRWRRRFKHKPHSDTDLSVQQSMA